MQYDLKGNIFGRKGTKSTFTANCVKYIWHSAGIRGSRSSSNVEEEADADFRLTIPLQVKL